jgi:hypothetical protein
MRGSRLVILSEAKDLEMRDLQRGAELPHIGVSEAPNHHGAKYPPMVRATSFGLFRTTRIFRHSLCLV